MSDIILKTFGTFGLILFIIAVVVFGPFFTIWAANTIFPALAIPYTLETWAATILLGGFFRGSSTSVSSK